VVFACAVLAFTAAPAQAQVSLGKAKELYASANYDEALTMLNALGSRSVSEDGPAAALYSEDSASIAMYRVLCLVAVGRSADVDAAIDRLVSQHPLFRPPTEELSPRMRTAVSTARLRLLPPMVQRRYEESKTAYDRGDFSTASIGFKWVLTALTDPDMSTLTGQSPFADIKTLAAGFIGLAEKALAPPPPVSPPVAIVAAPPAKPKPARDLTKVFSPDDTDVVAPVTTRQSMPQFPGVLKATATGALELVIDAAGTVESVRLMQSVHPRYDELLLVAAKKWQYQPALLDGTAVRYTKRIQISLAPPPTEASRR
jgi:TonB family protein